MSQLTYNTNMGPAIAGTLYDLSPSTIDSYLSEGITDIGFGVVAGTDPQRQAKVPAATFSTGFKGVALLQAKDQIYGTGVVQFADKDAMSVVRKGRVNVPFSSGNAIVAETAAYLIYSGVDAGKWTNAAGASGIGVAVTGAKFFTSNTSTTGGVVVVELA